MMTHRFIFAVLLGLFALSPVSAEWISVGNLRSYEEAPLLDVPFSDPSHTRVELAVPGISVETITRREGTFHKISMPETGFTTEIGDPELPQVTTLIAIPDQGDVELRVTPGDYTVLPNINVYPAQPEGDAVEGGEPEFVWNRPFYRSGVAYPAEVANIAQPVILRDFRVVPLTISPVQYNPSTQELRIYHNVEIELTYPAGMSINPKIRTRQTISRAFEHLYEATIANFDHLRDAYSVEDGSYLIIMPQAYRQYTQDLIDWRRRQGYRVEVHYVEDIGEIMPEYRDFIQDAYNEWEYPPEYVLLYADENENFEGGIPTNFYNSNAQIASDHLYSLVDGDDYFADIFVGRISVRNALDAYKMAYKIVNYESNPFLVEDDGWFRRGLQVGGGFPQFVVSTIETCNWARQEMLEYGYTQVDTVYDWAANPGSIGKDIAITNAVENGVSIINYRGWANNERWNNPIYRNTDVLQLENYGKWPVVFSVVCATANYAFGNEPCFAEAWLRAGSINNPQGAVGFFGSTYINTHTKTNNPITGGIFEGLFHRGMRTMGEVTNWGKIVEYLSFPGQSSITCEADCGANRDCWEKCVSFNFHNFVLLSDPATSIWTTTPIDITVDHPAEVPLGQNAVEVQVTDNSGAVEGAWVALTRYDGDEMQIHATGMTGTSGYVTLHLPAGVSAGEVNVTVTKADHAPYLGTLNLVQAPYQASVTDMSPAVANPNQTLNYTLEVRNTGENNLSGLTAALSSSDPHVTINTDTANLGDLNTGQSTTAEFEIWVHPEAVHNQRILFDVTLTDAGNHTFEGQAWLDVESSLLMVETATFDGNGYLDPGESANLTLTIRNIGVVDAMNVQATITTNQNVVTIMDDNGSFGTIPAGGSADNSGNPFTLSAPAEIFAGTPVRLTLHFTDESGTEQQYDYIIQAGEMNATAPIVPEYGTYPYFAYDNTDQVPAEYAHNVPTYDWIEIDPAYGGDGTALNLNDEFTIGYIELPFEFQFYGHRYDRLNVSPNGWVAFTDSDADPPYDWWNHELTYQYNTYMASPLAPEAAIAVYWDDLHPDASFVGCPENIGHGDAFYYHDAENHRVIVEWSRIEVQQGCSASDLGDLVTFQVILYDPVHYQTETGDGEIVCQYHTVEAADVPLDEVCSIGLIDHQRGNVEQWNYLQYLFYHHYHPAAAPLENERAIKFTTNGFLPTNAPMGQASVQVPNTYQLEQNVPNPFNPKTAIRYSVPVAGHSRLAVYDAGGRMVRVLNDGWTEAGHYTIQWDGTNTSGQTVKSGVYFYRLDAGDFSQTRRMVLLR